MKKNSKLFKVNVFLSVSIILLGITYIFLPAKTISSNLISFIPHRQTSYVIKSFNKASIEELKALDAPYVSVNPQSPIYQLNLIKEKIESRLGISKHNSLFYASKRLLELEKWKSELSVEESKYLINTYANIVDSYITAAISDPNKDSSLSKLWIAKQKTESQSEIFTSILNKSETSRSELIKNQELKIFFQSKLGDLNKKINSYIPNNQDNILIYSLHPIHNEYEYGDYELSYSNIATASNDLLKISLLNSAYDVISKSEIPLNLSQNITIDSQTSYISFEIDSEDITKGQVWKKNKIDQSYIYKKKISPLVSIGQALYFKYINNPYLLTISRQYRSDVTPDVIFQEEIKPKLGSSHREKEKIIDADREVVVTRKIDIIQTSLIESDIYVEISSTTELSEEDLTNINLQILPVYNPTILLNKINDYPINALNLNTEQKKPYYFDITTGSISLKQTQYLIDGLKPFWKTISLIKDDNQISGITVEYWPHWFMRYIVVLLIKLVFFINILAWLYKQKNRIPYKLIRDIISKISTFVYDTNIILFVMYVAIFPLLIFRPNIESDLVYIVLLLFGLIIVVSWRISINITLTFAIIHFLSAAIFYTFDYTNPSDKLAILTIILISVAALQAVLALVFVDHFNNGWKQLFQIILNNRYILKVKKIFMEFKK